MQKNNLFVHRFALDARQALLSEGKGWPEEERIRFFSRRIAFRFLESNGLLPQAADRLDPDSSRGFTELAQLLADRFPLFAGEKGVFDPKWVPVSNLPASLFGQKPGGNPEILGRLFQSFRTEERRNVCAEVRQNRKPEREKIPAATQLFTPDWIVRYLVENSLGRCGAEKLNPAGTEFLEECRQSPKTGKYLSQWHQTLNDRNPESIRLIDPCAGCGHILLYAFDLFLKLYRAWGYSLEDALPLILTRNLYGYEIDPPAADLARFALQMKCALSVPGLFSVPIPHNIISPADLPETAEFGSLLPQGKILSDRYDVVVTNPPYLGRGKMNRSLAAFISEEYPAGKADLFAAFMERCADLTAPCGMTAMITPQSWLFLSSFEQIRQRLFRSTLLSLLHLGPRAFESLSGQVTQTAAFVSTPFFVPHYTSRVFRLAEGGAADKETAFKKRTGEYQIRLDDYKTVPGIRVPYLLGKEASRLFRRGKPLRETGDPCQGLATGDNSQFLRLWYDVDFTEIGFGISSRTEALASGRKWFPYNKGGNFRRWYGNQEYLIDWESDGRRLRAFCREDGTPKAVLRNQHRYFQEGISWSKVAGRDLAVRYVPAGFLFDVAGCSVFYESKGEMLRGLGFLNSAAARLILSAISPTLNYEVGHIGSLPVFPLRAYGEEVELLVRENIELSRLDWDSSERSWGFAHHPFLDEGDGISSAFAAWKRVTEDRIKQLKANETRLNRIFLGLYGLKGEPEPKDSDIVLRSADWTCSIKSFLSYAVGLFTGRYRLDADGVQFAGGNWTNAQKGEAFFPVSAPVIPICAGQGEPNDLSQLIVRLLQQLFPNSSLEENLRALQNGLGESDGDPRETLQRYFLKSFERDHRKAYRNCPIYQVLPETGIRYRWRQPLS